MCFHLSLWCMSFCQMSCQLSVSCQVLVFLFISVWHTVPYVSSVHRGLWARIARKHAIVLEHTKYSFLSTIMQTLKFRSVILKAAVKPNSAAPTRFHIWQPITAGLLLVMAQFFTMMLLYSFTEVKDHNTCSTLAESIKIQLL